MTFLFLWLVNFHPVRAGGDLQFARRLYRDGFYELAAVQLRCFLEEDPSGPEAPEALLLMAHALFKEGRWKEAAEVYGRFLARYPEDIWAGEALWGRALSLSKLGRHLEAAEAFLELYRRIPAGKRAASALLKAAEGLRRAGRPDSALSVLGELERTFPSATGEEVRYEKALCLKASGRLREALEGLEGLSCPDALLTLGRISLSLGEVARAEKALRELEEKFPEESSTALLALEMARRSMEEGDEDRACHLFVSALGSSLPGDLVPSALLGAARAFRLTGDASGALARCDTFLSNFPGHPLEPD
ncbi:MAG TPA: tetratricopeptide repeat protein, partial [Candidatus Latescibacteria bacterium]|nr:tetratricopeptide repeat protein [Candidatus Latescibacterota bacterium]